MSRRKVAAARIDPPEYMRKVIFRPYARGLGLPYFVLYLLDWHGGLSDRPSVDYRLTEVRADGTFQTVTEGDDFHPGAISRVDGDEAVESLMTFLTLREGDTDSETFENLISTPRHLEFSREHAEAVSAEVAARFTCCECGGTRELRRVVRDGYPVKACASCRGRRS